MTPDADLQAWLDVQAAERHVVAPYVRSALPVAVTYDLRVIRVGRGGRAEARQQGQVALRAEQATPLGTMSVSSAPGDACQVELVLAPQGEEPRRFSFDCPNGT
ncbi:hypothetical protein FOZ76_21970 [Verticiella sediminum]|uniref:Curli assembly protein CsgC n=1 Tax=Verticiella sediminum TaxID=1247510 RepID=A0A556AC70_9BURK|nr:curli-like amyloid fiber formation chaperone CsgH [Verticiella sediminum]TSH90481.1 hypothetical protein FOZ76_21970 [Verticiella sediminum]